MGGGGGGLGGGDKMGGGFFLLGATPHGGRGPFFCGGPRGK